jgi:transcription initiation factor TFIID subunit 12
MNQIPKMPISKTINPTPPTPVQMGPSRPTLGGSSNGVNAPGVLGQPVIQKPTPIVGWQLEGDDGRVLSKKKLDELVRQVTGTDGGGAMSGEVEEVRHPRLIFASPLS